MIDDSPLDDDVVQALMSEFAQSAARTALAHFRQELTIELKDDASPVTVADTLIERGVRDVLSIRFPDHSILGEEFGSTIRQCDHVWIVDPIDGTRSFISGQPLFGFLMAYLYAGECRHSAVSMPALNELYLGHSGGCATLNGQPVRTSNKTQMSQAYISINEAEKLFTEQRNVFEQLIHAGHTRRFAYDCYPHALLAAGHIDVVVDYDLKPFDYLPLVALIDAAGGCISDWQGQPLGFHSNGRVLSSATPELHKQMLKLLECAA